MPPEQTVSTRRRLAAATAIILDETPLSLLTQKRGHALGDRCREWYAALSHAGCRFYVPEIADYELRRELLRSGRDASVRRLDQFNNAFADRYLPLSTADVRLAAQLWAAARNRGRAGASAEALDGDVLIAAQAIRLEPTAHGLAGVIVATANVAHFAALTDVALWSGIAP